MYPQKEQLLEQYDIEVKSVAKGRGTVIAETSEGRVLLTEYRGSKEKLPELARVLAYLKQWDARVEQLIPNAEGEYLTTDTEGASYLLKTYVPGKECDTSSRAEILAAVGALARLHVALGGYPEEIPEAFYIREHEFSRELFRHNRELNNVKNYIRRKKKRNAFEELFQENFAYYYQQAMDVAAGYEHYCRTWGETGCGLCHGDFNQHNVVGCPANPHILHFEQMRFEDPVSDLAKFMRKVLEKNRWEKKLGMDMLMAYEGIKPLSDREQEQLCLRLAYPEKFWKIANHYNNSRKAWVSGRDIEKLQSLKSMETGRKEFLKMLYSLGE